MKLRTEAGLLLAAALFYGLGRLLFHLLDGSGTAFEWAAVRLAPLALVLAAVYRFAHLNAGPFRRFVDPVFALLPAIFLLVFDTVHYVDDAGFILRYLDNFQEGCFYCYNTEDGPIFGISSFLYGILTGLPAMAGVKPETCLLLVTALGAWMSGYFILRMLGKASDRPAIAFLLAVLVFFGARTWLNAANSGMEAALHLGVSLGAVWFFIARRERAMWLFLALAVISKLDAVPLAGVLGLWHLLRSGERLRTWAFWRNLLLYAGVPLLIFVLTAWALFGSVFPQSAYAKLYFHFHAKGDFFPFWSHFLTYPLSKWTFVAMCALLPLHVVAGLRDRSQFKFLAPLAALAGVLALYYVYNPGERMIWYYVLPEGLMLAQLSLSLAVTVRWLPGRWRLSVVVCLVGGTLLAAGSRTVMEMKAFRQSLFIMDGERARLGAYLATRVQPGDTLLAAHGLTARPADGYVADATGLNWAPAIGYALDHGRILAALRPKWVVDHAWGGLIGAANAAGYVHDTAAYDITRREGLPWIVLRRAAPGETPHYIRRLSGDAFTGEELELKQRPYWQAAAGKSVEMALPGVREGALMLGVYTHGTPFLLRAEEWAGGKMLSASEHEIPATDRETRWSFALEIPLASTDSVIPDRVLRIFPARDADRLLLVDPMLVTPAR